MYHFDQNIEQIIEKKNIEKIHNTKYEKVKLDTLQFPCNLQAQAEKPCKLSSIKQ